jgi:hypothetical protein
MTSPWKDPWRQSWNKDSPADDAGAQAILDREVLPGDLEIVLLYRLPAGNAAVASVQVSGIDQSASAQAKIEILGAAACEALESCLRRLAARTTAAIPKGRTLDTVTAEEWRAAGSWEREEFLASWRRRGVVSFSCTGCGFPAAFGRSSCEACR